MTKANFGNSLLPSHDARTYEVLEGLHGQFQVRPNAAEEEHTLYYQPPPTAERPEEPRGWCPLASHPNGHSCKNLAQRILMVWKGQRQNDYALQQYKLILDSGGMGRKEETIMAVIRGEY